VQPSTITRAFVSHQDPDIASSLSRWNACNDKIRWYVPDLSEGLFGTTARWTPSSPLFPTTEEG
jgi:hypothetical protein